MSTHCEIGMFKTEHATKYIQQLCKHFAHKVQVEFTETNGLAELPPGPARMMALKDALRIEINGEDAAGLERARYIIDSHLERFAFREDFKTMDWQPA
jgi:hypothetical protein